MPPNVVSGAMLQCTMGLAPAPLTVLPTARVMVEGRPAANIMDFKPFVNIPSFGTCRSPANPATAALTAAALGTLTPGPCTPVPTGPWQGGALRTLVGGAPALTMGAMCMCAYAGVITLTAPSAVRTQSS